MTVDSLNMRTSRTIYGREEPLAILQEAFRWASLGSTELILLSGPPGIGKSAFVLEAFKPAVAGKCYFAWGKFDPYNKKKPFEPVIKCFQFLIQRLLTEPETVLRQWGENLKKAVGPGGSVITEVIPEAKLILGEFPPSEPLSAAESRHRFEWVFRRFVRAFAKAQYPLVLFFDDIQWADKAMLQLLHSLISDPENQHLCIVVAYRDREWDGSAEFLDVWLGEGNPGYSVRQLQLEPLDIASFQSIISDALGCEPDTSYPLAHALFVKSMGNPFYMKQLLQSAFDERIVHYRSSTREWEWDTGKLDQFPDFEGQLDFLIDRINKLPAPSKRLLVCAACLGGKFSSRLLCAVNRDAEAGLADHLSYAVRAGLLAVAGDADEGKEYFFTHDRIHQAAYSLLDERERMNVHLAAGTFLLGRYKSDDKEQALFEMVNHMNQALDLLPAEEREMVARLNDQAGRKAMLSAAFETASGYFNIAADCLPDEYWSEHNEYTFQLHLKRAECDYLCAHYERAAAQLDRVMERTQSWAQRAQVAKLKIEQYSNVGKYAQAIELGLATLGEVGVHVSSRPNPLTVAKEIFIARRLLNRRIDELSTLPMADDPQVKIMMELLVSLVAPTFFFNREVFHVLASRFIRLVYRYGRTPVTPVIYASFGMLLSTKLNDFSSGFRLGTVAVDLADQSGIASVKSKVYVMFYFVISPWMRFDRNDEAKLSEALKLGMEAGDYIYASYAVGSMMNLSYARDTMSEMHKVMRQSLQVMEHIKEELVYRNVLIYMHLADMLQSDRTGGFSITDGRASESEFLEDVLKDGSGAVTIYQIYTYKTQICYLFGQYREAVLYAELADPYEALSAHSVHLAIHHFYEALALAEVCRELPAGKGRVWRRRLKRRYRQFKRWSDMSPENFKHRLALIEAEMARQSESEQVLIELFDRSIALARESRDHQHLAVACERAAKYHLLKGRERIARGYMQEAYEAYGKWGVESKRSSLRKEYPDWFEETKSEHAPKPAAPADLSPEQKRAEEERDLIAIVKDSLTLSHDMNFHDIGLRLMALIMQTSGADKGCLISRRDSGLWVERAVNGNTGTAGRSGLLQESGEAPGSLIHYVSRLGQLVQVENAAQDDLFQNDPYIMQNQCRSVSCLPLYAQEQFAGVLYLELPPSLHPLPDARVDTLSILATQALFISKLSESFGDATVFGAPPSAPSEQRDVDALTDRELEVLNLMSAGLTNKEIAVQLGVTAGTVKVHTHNIFSKLNVNRRTKAIAEAVRKNLLG